jgi:short-subunit dehydrogenase
VETFGRLDVMICNAGFGVYGPIDDISADTMRRLVDVNYLGTYFAARAALAVFRRQGTGHLIVVSSFLGKRAVPYTGAYCATKFAQAGLAESLRAELAGSAIHVTTVFPISTDTEFFEVMTRASGFVTRAQGPRQSADDVADAIAGAIARPVAELFPYRKARAVILLNAMMPALCDRLVKRWGRKPVRAAR